jgi:hypothetical protein
MSKRLDELAAMLRKQEPDRVDLLFEEGLQVPPKRSSTPITTTIMRVIKERQISANGLAKASGVSQSIISRWLSGERAPSLASLEKIMVALDLTVIE